MAKTLPESSIPEVAAFVEAKERVDRLKEAYPEVFEQLSILAEDYNSTLEAAFKAVKAKNVSCGPFDRYQEQKKYDASKLYDAVGRERFLELGGKTTTVTEFSVDRARLEASIAASMVPQDVVEEVLIISPRYKQPEKITL